MQGAPAGACAAEVTWLPCSLPPVPRQMYTFTTIILVLQSVYYEIVAPKHKAVHVLETDASVAAGADTFTQPLLTPRGPASL